MAENTIKSRIQLKNDTEANWNKATNFIPKKGELIIYTTDSTYNYPRIKVGDGLTLVSNLPFIEAQVVSHKLTFGTGGVYQFDGSADVTIPVYTGTFI